ncbi:unnamed protein product [Discosporangium mesarthrocarpum]
MHLTNVLTALGFELCLSDPCVFRCFSGKEILLTLAHRIDDMFVVGHTSECNALCVELKNMFPTKNLGELKWYTGCAFTQARQAGKIKVTQTAYIDQICERFSVITTSPTPAATSLKLLRLQGHEEECEEKFRALIVRALARHMQAPSKTHWKAGLRVLKFLRKTRDWGVTFQKIGQMRLYAYADSSYGGDEDDRRSVSGGAVMFAGSVVA